MEGEGGWRVGGGGVAPNFVSINFFGLVCRGAWAIYNLKPFGFDFWKAEKKDREGGGG